MELDAMKRQHLASDKPEKRVVVKPSPSPASPSTHRLGEH
ncbi:hypothetical protein ACP4OV_001780 [Aristida adscensionis]